MLTNALGYLAASLVLATFCAKRMVALRSIAIASNLAFIGYGYLDSLWPILILHVVMLPINIVRCRQSMRACCSVAEAETGMARRNRSASIRRSLPLRDLAVGALERIRALPGRERVQRELRTMAARDFAAPKMPPGVRRWSWQKPSTQAHHRIPALGEDRYDLEDPGRAD
ncbi:MAG TPA: hypothetical protein VME45_14675 [Stellaceae bacterium]|nr:hypothetical protein [Stellaceae bacterium]